MLKEKMKKARKQYKHLDLDGNQQADYEDHHHPKGIKKLVS